MNQIAPLPPKPLDLPAVARPFQPDALALESESPARASRLMLYAVLGLFAAAVAWAALSQVDRIVVTEGRLVTTSPNLVVQPLETSVIRSIAVQPGDTVHAGDTLATLDPTFASADVAQLRARLESREAQIARLAAEINGEPYRAPPGATAEQRLQEAAFAQRAAWRGARLRELDERAARAEAGIATAQQEQQSAAGRLEVLRELEDMRVQLLRTQAGSRVALLETRNQRMEIEGRSDQLRLSLVELRHELDTVRAERQSFLEEQRRTAFDEMVRLRDEREALAEELGKATRRRELVTLNAPGDAVVLQVADRSIGSVLKEAEPLMTLVPLNSPLEAELAVEARDIGRIEVGQPVRIKLDAWPYQEHGTLSGSLRMVSEGAFPRDEPQRPGVVYRTRARIEDIALRGVPEGFRLLPGMPVTGEVTAGRRNVLMYILDPLLRGLDESLREP